MKKERILSPFTVERVLTESMDGLYTYFRILNSEPGEVYYSVTFESAEGEYWAKVVNQKQLDWLLKR